ncbi:MAG TPA: regulatory protein RecX [Gammaproteobacteria bacterium]|jgi:regulatory protein|nr:regulatory protein RecX [Gammaproteobacteria bacterium]
MPSKPKPKKSDATPYDIAVGLLARREHSRTELQRKLMQRGCEAAAIDDALDTLERERLLSDARFAEQFVRSRVERGAGPAKIRSDLRQRGVADSIADAALEDYAADWRQRIQEVRRKRFGEPLPDEYRERARQARFLQSRGFTADQIGRVLDED